MAPSNSSRCGIAAIYRKGGPPPALPAAQVEHRFGDVPRVPTWVPTPGSARGFPASTAGRQLPGGRIEHDQPGRVHYTGSVAATASKASFAPGRRRGFRRSKLCLDLDQPQDHIAVALTPQATSSHKKFGPRHLLAAPARTSERLASASRRGC